MKKMLKFLSILLLLFFEISSLKSQNIESTTIQGSNLIVEGIIVKQEYRYNPDNPKQIQTINFLQVDEELKGTIGDQNVAIIADGGQIDNIIQSNSHKPKLTIGEKGIFFLKTLTSDSDLILTEFTQSTKNLLTYVSNSEKEVYCNHDHVYYPSIGEIKRQIKPSYNSFTSSVSHATELCLSIDNIRPDFSTNKVLFDIKIKANQTGLKFSELSVNFEYPKGNLGENIVQNNKLGITRGPVIQDNLYSVNISDVTKEKAEISIKSNCLETSSLQLSNYYTLSKSYEKLATVELSVENWGALGDLTIEDFNFNGTAKHIDQNNICREFDILCVDRAGFLLVPCSITSISTAPFGAGVQQILEIQGSGFGVAGQLEIPNADDGGLSKLNIQNTDTRWLKSWSDTKIEVLVSSLAPGDHPMGSGEWVVNPLVNMTCDDDVDVEYAIDNVYAAPDERMMSIATDPFSISFSPPMGNDSYKWYIDRTGIMTNASLIAQGITYNDVLAVCQAAFCDWESATGLEFTFSGDNPNGLDPTDKKYTVTVGTTTGNFSMQTDKTRRINQCTPADDPYVNGRLLDADIVFDEFANWFVSTSNSGIPGNKVDFYSLILHEIGHMMLMQHSCDIPLNGTMDDRIMYWGTTSPGQIKRNIDNKTLNGITVQKARTDNAINNDCLSGYVMNTMTDMCTTPVLELYDSNEIGFQNPINVRQDVTVKTETIFHNVTIFDLRGNVIQRITNNRDKNIQIRGLNDSGIYFLSFERDGYFISKKLIVQ